MDKDKTEKEMNRRNKRSDNQTNWDNFDEKAMALFRETRYKEAFKAAAKEYSGHVARWKNQKHGCGARAVAEKYNKAMLSSPNDRKIKRNTLHNAVVNGGNSGVSPPKQGAPGKVPRSSLRRWQLMLP